MRKDEKKKLQELSWLFVGELIILLTRGKLVGLRVWSPGHRRSIGVEEDTSSMQLRSILRSWFPLHSRRLSEVVSVLHSFTSTSITL